MLARKDRCVRGFSGDVWSKEGSEPSSAGSQSVKQRARGATVAVATEMVCPEGIGDDQKHPHGMQLTSRAVSIAIGGCGPATPDRPVQCGGHRRPAVADPPHRSRVRLLIMVSDHGTGSHFSHYSLWPGVWLVAALWRRAPTAFARDFVTDLAAGLGADFTAGRPAGKTTGRPWT